jgi:hypothetical protein
MNNLDKAGEGSLQAHHYLWLGLLLLISSLSVCLAALLVLLWGILLRGLLLLCRGLLLR